MYKHDAILYIIEFVYDTYKQLGGTWIDYPTDRTQSNLEIFGSKPIHFKSRFKSDLK